MKVFSAKCTLTLHTATGKSRPWCGPHPCRGKKGCLSQVATTPTPTPTPQALTFLASSILLSKTKEMQFLTTSSRRALLASSIPFRSMRVPGGKKSQPLSGGPGKAPLLPASRARLGRGTAGRPARASLLCDLSCSRSSSTSERRLWSWQRCRQRQPGQ